MKVKLNTIFPPSVGVGETESHFGVLFTVIEDKDSNLCYVAEVSDKDGEAMIEAGRVAEVEDEAGGGSATRDEMKAFLAGKGVEFPANIKADKLAELYATEKAKAE